MIRMYIIVSVWNMFVKILLTVILALLKKPVKLEGHAFSNLMIVLSTLKRQLTYTTILHLLHLCLLAHQPHPRKHPHTGLS